MASTTVTGRVRATVRLKNDEGGEARVVAVSWASDRAFPRTRGVGATFELETSDSVVLRVEPFEALVTLPARRRLARDGVRREEAWLAHGNELTVEGELDAAGTTIVARRITRASAICPLHLPPRALERGELEALADATPASDPEPVAPESVAPESVAPESVAPESVTPESVTPESVAPESVAPESIAPESIAPEPVVTPPGSAADATSEPAVARRPKKKRPDSSGTPPPIQ